MTRCLVLYNSDYDLLSEADLDDLSGARARADVAHVADAVAGALGERGFRTVQVPIRRPADVVRALRHFNPDVVFNLCESLVSDPRYEPAVVGLLERLGAVFTGNGQAVLRLCLDKAACNEALRRAGVPVPWSALVRSVRDLPTTLPFPAIVKPNREDGSTGIHSGSVVHDREHALAEVAQLCNVGKSVIVQHYIGGREVNVALLGGADGGTMRVLPMAEIDFSEMPPGIPHIVSYAAKWDPESPEWRGTRVVPASLPEPMLLRLARLARAVGNALDLGGYARVDVRIDGMDRPHVVDVNPNCDIGPTAGLSRAAARAGLDYPDLVVAVVQHALARSGLPQPDPRLAGPRSGAARTHLRTVPCPR